MHTRLQTDSRSAEDTTNDGDLAQRVGLGLGLVSRSGGGSNKVARRDLVLVGGCRSGLGITISLSDLLVGLGDRRLVILLLLLFFLLLLLLLFLGSELGLSVILVETGDKLGGALGCTVSFE